MPKNFNLYMPLPHQVKMLKKAIWVYFFLLIFEGALRKWILPGFDSALLIIRDPIAVWIIILAIRTNLFPSSTLVNGILLISAIGFFTAIFFGHGNLIVAVYGARLYALHFPLIYIIGRVFTKEDVIKMGKVFLLLAIPMTVLIAIQFYSPQSAWVNRGVGGNLEGAGFGGANGYFRPPGTFSFIIGLTLFYSSCAVYVAFFLINPQKINIVLLSASTAALLISVPLSISRTLFFSVSLTLIFLCIALLKNNLFSIKIVLFFSVLVIGILLLRKIDLFETGMEAFISRFTGANEVEGGLEGVAKDRFLGMLWLALTESLQQPTLGYGIGMGTSVGSQILTGKPGHLISEQEWQRTIGELGPILGISLIFIRLKLCFQLTVSAFKKLSYGNTLPWLFLSVVLVIVSQGQWMQPGILGFSVLLSGLAIAALK